MEKMLSSYVYILRNFEKVFSQEPDEIKIDALVHEYGQQRIEEVISYLVLHGLKPNKDNRPHSPYGLLIALAKTFDRGK